MKKDSNKYSEKNKRNMEYSYFAWIERERESLTKEQKIGTNALSKTTEI